MTPVDERFAYRVRRVRMEYGWSIQELADRAGVARMTISKLESGQRRAHLGEAVRLAEVLGVPLEDLIKDAPFVVFDTMTPGLGER